MMLLRMNIFGSAAWDEYECLIDNFKV